MLLSILLGKGVDKSVTLSDFKKSSGIKCDCCQDSVKIYGTIKLTFYDPFEKDIDGSPKKSFISMKLCSDCYQKVCDKLTKLEI